MAPLLTDGETNGQMDERNPLSLRFCPFLNIPDSSKRKNPECFYTRTIKAVYSILGQSRELCLTLAVCCL